MLVAGLLVLSHTPLHPLSAITLIKFHTLYILSSYISHNCCHGDILFPVIIKVHDFCGLESSLHAVDNVECYMLRETCFFLNIKVSLFRTYFTLLCTIHLRWNYIKYSIRKLNITYNDIMRILLCLPTLS